jgi:hypothetical protein
VRFVGELFEIKFRSMKVYRISRAKLDELRPSLMKRMAVFMTILVGAAVFISFSRLGSETDLRLIAFAVPLLGATFTLAMFRGAAKARAQTEEMVATFELVLDAGRLIRRQKNLPEITLNYSDIRQIQEHGNRGLNIVGMSRLDVIGITSAVENYEQLKADLVLLTGLEIPRKSGLLAQSSGFLALVVVLSLMAVSFLAPNRFIASGASFFFAAISLVAIVLIRRSPNIPKELKGRLFLGLIPAIVLLARGVLLLRSH